MNIEKIKTELDRVCPSDPKMYDNFFVYEHKEKKGYCVVSDGEYCAIGETEEIFKAIRTLEDCEIPSRKAWESVWNALCDFPEE